MFLGSKNDRTLSTLTEGSSIWYNFNVTVCKLCKQKFESLTNSHLKFTHNLTPSIYKKKFPGENIQFTKPPNLFPKNSQVFIKWKNSLKKRNPPWNKGYTKKTHPGVLKISRTMKKKRIDNFAKWRLKMIKLGKIRNTYPPFKKSKELAFLIGLALGDGNISAFPRTECLTISLNTKYPTLVAYTKCTLNRLFEKTSSQERIGNCVRLRIYQKYISKRLDILTGDRHKAKLEIPHWIWKSRKFLTWYLKGLFEAEGSLSIHLRTYTYNFQFSNLNRDLLKNVGELLEKLGFHPEYRDYATRLRKRKEVEDFKNLISFRKFNLAG